MLPGGARVGVAVSGGADSVCLLDVLASMAAGQGWRLTVLHLNHGWRGAESDADAGFVEDLAGRYSLPCVTGKAAPPAGGNLEQQGREARRRFFAEQRRTLGLDRIATGHTLDDQAETVLFRALRGAGPGGLAGILPVTAEGIVRPLLGVKREWVLAWNRRRGLAWREDPTNADPRFRRNALRALLPELARLVNPAAVEALARLAVIAQDEEIDWCERVALLGVKREWVLAWNRRRGLAWREDPTNADPRFRRNALRALLPELARLVNPAAVEALARLAVIAQDEEIDWCERVALAGREVWREEEGAWVARVDEIAGRGQAMARRLIRQGVENVRGGLNSVDYAHIERVLALVERRGGEGKVQLPGGWAERSCGWLRIGGGAAQVVEEREVEGPGGRAVLRAGDGAAVDPSGRGKRAR
ncbi:MAG TPA: tRNA lysidine(34) synthetase TilS, partial [Bryobacteraceae bacterium]|nr:tRNA lysidine(34) synthetase TilS [Bryobacteraceae bacterium]